MHKNVLAVELLWGGGPFMDEKKKNHVAELEIPQILPVIPTIDVVVFPNMVVPLLVLDEKIIKGIERSGEENKKVLLLAAHQHDNADMHGPISINDLYKIGTVANVMRIMNLPEGGVKILIQGLVKARVKDILSDEESLHASIDVVSEPEEINERHAERQIKSILQLVERIAATGRIFGPDFQVILSQIQDPERIADFILSHLNLSVSEAQTLLEKESINHLLDGINEYLQHEVEVNNVQEKIRVETRDSINRSQREYYLREQMKAIQKELGDEGESEIGDLRRKANELPMSSEARTEAIKQIKRLEKTAPDSMEATVLRNHLEWLLGMPWGVYTKDNTDLVHAKNILDDHHFGLAEIKDRLLDFLSVKSLKEDSNVPIICFVGPPGVGKTSLGKSIAACLGRGYFRISLGGVYDESEIRGHRRTYVGALPGRFIQAVRKSGSMNPVIIIDEIDKLGMSNRGDPSAALLEVLDPEQNSTFYDNYLGVHFDLSKCMFVATANDLSTIPGPLRDRMEIITLAGYTLDEKIEIAKTHLVTDAIDKCGLINKTINIDSAIIEEVVSGYTRESGVRDLERQIHKLCSKYARHFVEKHEPVVFTKDNLPEFLGPRKVPFEILSKKHKVGVTNGLAWTPHGGEVLQVEAILVPGNGKLILTGQLGDVMKESAQAALSYAKSHAGQFSIDKAKFSEHDLHIHLPAGGIPKDGPSAGITLLSSVLSVFTSRPINSGYAMTGELSLHGSVLPIGGLKEKILAARQNELVNVIMPKRNEIDLYSIDKKMYQGMNLLLVEEADEVLNYVLMPA